MRNYKCTLPGLTTRCKSDNRLGKALYQSCLGAKDTTQSFLEMLVGLLKKCCCHQKCCGCVGCAVV